MLNILLYPPTPQQLRMMEYVGYISPVSLIILRVLAIFMLLWGMKLWLNIFKSKSSIWLLLISPAFFLATWLYPLQIVKIFGLIVLAYFFKKQVLFIFLAGALIILFNLLVIGDKPAVVNKFSFKDSQTEVNNRFAAEDSLRDKVIMPLWWRRVVYNKYFFTYRNILSEIVPAFDLESLFFQEVHPLSQKSGVMFYWPEIFLLILGIYQTKKLKNFKNQKLIMVFFILGLINFVFSEGVVFLRLLILMLPMSILIAYGIESLTKIRVLYFGVWLLLTYSTVINFTDLNKRIDFWLDNRPLAMEFWFQNIKKLDYSSYDHIQISSMIGNPKSYCVFYLGSICNDNKFVFEGFNIKNNSPKSGLYAGFAGEFVGANFNNDISQNWIKEMNDSGNRVLSTITLRDTIANKFGNDIGLIKIK